MKNFTYNLKGHGEVDNRNTNEYVGDKYIVGYYIEK